MLYVFVVLLSLVGVLSVDVISNPDNTEKCVVTIQESTLPQAVQTHEIVHIPDSNMILISQLSSSSIVKAIVNNGVIQDSRAYQIDSNTSALHGLSVSTYYKGRIWVTLEGAQKLLLLDPTKESINLPPVIIKEITVPNPGRGPHYIGEYGEDLWVTLKYSDQVLRINHLNNSDYDIYEGLSHPIFAAHHPINQKFYASEDGSSRILKINPDNKETTQIEIPSSVGSTPVGLISGVNGIWFVLLGNKTQGTGTFGFIDANDKITYFKLNSAMCKDASLLHLAFDSDVNENPGIWLLASSIVNPNSIDMLIRVTFDSYWENILSEEAMALPTQKCKAHRIRIVGDEVYVTELASHRVVSFSKECNGCGQNCQDMSRSENSDNSQNTNNNNVGIIVGAVLGSIGIISLIVAVLILVCKPKTPVTDTNYQEM